MTKRKVSAPIAEFDKVGQENVSWQYAAATGTLEREPISKSVVICVPQRLEDVQRLIDIIKNRQPLIMDLTGINGQVACRILDFMSGAVYALSGSMQNYKSSFYLITPSGCEIKQFMQ